MVSVLNNFRAVSGLAYNEPFLGPVWLYRRRETFFEEELTGLVRWKSNGVDYQVKLGLNWKIYYAYLFLSIGVSCYHLADPCDPGTIPYHLRRTSIQGPHHILGA